MYKSSMKKMAFRTTNEKAASFGLLFSRITIGLTIAYYVVTNFSHSASPGAHFTLAYAVWVTAICSSLVLLGILTRPAALVLVAILFLYNRLLFHNDVIHPWEELMTLYTAFYVLILVSGPGRYSLDTLFVKDVKHG